MAAPSNGAGNLVEEFEESFQSCLNVLTKQEAGPCVEKEEVKVEVERFIELGRQMEAFFLQKRFLLSALKPELLVKEDNNELRLELARKEELLKRHYDKIAVWQNLLADLQGYGGKCGGQSNAVVAPPGGTSPAPSVQLQHPPHAAMQVQQGVQSQLQQQQAGQQQQQQQLTPQQVVAQQQQAAAAAAVAAQQQQQQLAAQQAAQLQQLQQQQLQQQLHQQHAMQQMSGVGQGMFMQQGAPFQQPGALQGPLAYLEKTTTNIDLVGMGDGRR